MLQIQQTGQIPTSLWDKIKSIHRMCESGTPFQFRKWKKISGLKNAFSCRLSRNYRILFVPDWLFFVADHDRYEQKIAILKRAGG